MDGKNTNFKNNTFSLNLEYGNILLLVSFYNNFYQKSDFKNLMEQNIRDISIFESHKNVISFDVPFPLIDNVLHFITQIRKTDIIDNEIYLTLLNRLEIHFMRVKDRKQQLQYEN